MSGRTFVVIFFFWALLTIITPTLVHLSETAKSQHLNGERNTEETKTRRLMMGYVEKHPIRTPKARENNTQTAAPAPAPAPAPAVETQRKRKAYIGKVFSVSLRLVVNKTRLNVA